MPTLAKSMLTARPAYFENAPTLLPLLTDGWGAEVRSHKADATTHHKLPSLWPASLQGVLHSSRTDCNIFFFSMHWESTPRLIHLHHLAFF